MNGNNLKEKIASFCDFASANYGGKNLFQARRREECEFAKALTAFHATGQPEREDVRATVSDPYSAHYFANFAVRCASFAVQTNEAEDLHDPHPCRDHQCFAVQTNEAEDLRHGALALVIDADVLDPRDLYGALGVLYEAATRLGIDIFRQVIAPVIEIATASRRKLIRDFFFHPEIEQSIGKLGAEIVYLDGLPWFRFTHF